MILRFQWRINVLLQLLVVVLLVQCHGVEGGLLSRLLPVWSHYGNQATGSSSHNSSSSSSIRQLLSVHTAATASGKRYAADPAGPLVWRFPTIAHSHSRPADKAASDMADSGGSEDEAAAEESEASSTFAAAEDTADSNDTVLSQTAHSSTSAADKAAATQGARDTSTTAESTPATEAADMSIIDDADAADSSKLHNVSANALDTAMADAARHKVHHHKQFMKPAWCSKAQGKVSRVECWTDQQGVITGIQLTDDAGMRQPGICSIGQGSPSGGGVLHEFESVVEVKACKAHALSSHHGYSYMEIWTDGGRAQPITCGTMQAGSKCEVINSGKTPRWAQPAAKPGHKWFKQQGYTPDKYIINGQVYEKVSTFDPYAGVTGSDPAYFREVFPLSELKATCNKHGHLSRLESACWNKQYKPKPREVLLGVKLTMDDFYTCPKKADEMHPMVCYVSDAVREMLYKQGIEVKAKIAPVECKSDMFSNTTISFIAKLNALNFKSHGLFSAKIMHSVGGDELCDSHNSLACDQHGIFDWEVEQMYKAPKGVKWLQGVCTPKPLPALPLGDGFSAGTPAQGYSSLLQPPITAPQPLMQPAVPSPMVPPPGYINTGPIIQPPRVPAPEGRVPMPRHEPAPVRTPPQPQSPFIENLDPQPLPPFIGQEDQEDNRLLEGEPAPSILPPMQRQTPPMEQQTPLNGDDVEGMPWQPMPGPVARPPVGRGPAPVPAPLAPQMLFIEYVDPQLSVPSSDKILEGTAPQQSPWLLGVNDGFFSDIQSPDYDDADTTPPVPPQPLLQPVLQQPPKTLLTPLKQQQQPKAKPRAQPLSPPSQPGPRLQPVLGVPERSALQNPKPQPKPNPSLKVQPKPQQKLSGVRPQQQQQQTKQKPRAPLPQQQQGVAEGSPEGFNGMMHIPTGPQQQQQQQQQQPWLLAQPQQKPVLTREQPKLQRQQTKPPQQQQQQQQQQQWQQPGLVQQHRQQHRQKPGLQPQQQQVRPVQQPALQQSGWQQQQPSQPRPRQQPAQQMQQQPQKQDQQQQPKPRPIAPQTQPTAQQPWQAHQQRQQQQQQPPVAEQVAPQQQAARPPQKQGRRKPKLQQQQQQLWTQPPLPQQPLAQQGVAVGLGAGVSPQSGGQRLQPGSTSVQKAKRQQRAKQLTKQKQQQQQRNSQQGQQPPLYQQQLLQRPQAVVQAPGSTWEQGTVQNGQQPGHVKALQPPPRLQQQQQQRSQRQHTPQKQQQHAPQQHHKHHHKQIGTVRVAPEAPLPHHGTPQHQQDSGWSPTDASSQAVWKTDPATRASHIGSQQQQQQQSSGEWGSWLLHSLGKVAGAIAQSSATSMQSR